MIEWLNRELNAALAQPDIVRRIVAFGVAQRARRIPAVRATAHWTDGAGVA